MDENLVSGTLGTGRPVPVPGPSLWPARPVPARPAPTCGRHLREAGRHPRGVRRVRSGVAPFGTVRTVPRWVPPRPAGTPTGETSLGFTSSVGTLYVARVVDYVCVIMLDTSVRSRLPGEAEADEVGWAACFLPREGGGRPARGGGGTSWRNGTCRCRRQGRGRPLAAPGRPLRRGASVGGPGSSSGKITSHPSSRSDPRRPGRSPCPPSGTRSAPGNGQTAVDVRPPLQAATSGRALPRSRTFSSAGLMSVSADMMIPTSYSRFRAIATRSTASATSIPFSRGFSSSRSLGGSAESSG